MSAIFFTGEPSTEFFPTMVTLLEEELSLGDSSSLADGVSTYNTVTSTLEVVLSRARQYVAIRKIQATAEKLEVLELFHVIPEDGRPRLGLTIRGSTALPATKLVNAVINLCAHTDKRLPQFFELLTILLAEGDVQCNSLEHLHTIEGLKADVMHQAQALDDMAFELQRQRAKLAALLNLPTKETRAMVNAIDSGFESVEQIAEWASRNEANIVVLPRALASVKKSRYARPDLICRGLELLAGPYRRFKAGEMTPNEFQECLAEHNFKIEGSVAANVAGEQGEAYFVKWEGQREFMGWHLEKGGGRDERFCLRMYFFWDAKSSRVVVGHMPSHLPNSLS